MPMMMEDVMKLDSIKLMPRLLGAFTIVAAIAIVIGMVGYNTVNDINNTHMPGIIALKDIAHAQRAVLMGERALKQQNGNTKTP